MNICFVASYPNKNTNGGIFVKQLVEELARQGHSCQVVSPYSVTKFFGFHKYKEIKDFEKGKVVIYRPNFLSFSNLKFFNKSVSLILHKLAVTYALKRLPEKPDAIYGHFWESAYEAYEYASNNNIPLFVASGESEIKMTGEGLDEFVEYVTGVICVSTKNMNESIGKGLTTKEKCIILPNSVDAKLFRLLDKQNCRKQIGISPDDFVVAFVGAFIERKGVMRLSQALDGIDDIPIKVFFIGGGNQDPVCNGIVFKDKLPHEKIPVYLNAADVFVLPTLHEGCCNAIVEAMACGLPVISSDLPFNWDILNKENSIMVDPNDIDAIGMAIRKLALNPEIRKEMSVGALNTASKLGIEQRAENVVDFIKEKIMTNNK